jgi:hypothetical protein
MDYIIVAKSKHKTMAKSIMGKIETLPHAVVRLSIHESLITNPMSWR